MTPEYWAADLDVNLRSAFLCAHAAIPHMRKAGGGRIVNFADWLARSGRPHYTGFTSYYVAKAGVIALTEALALETAQGPHPGQRDRARPDRAAAGHDARRRSRRWPRRRRCAGGAARSEIARAVVFLCETEFVTGETIRVDGGRHLE